jgi:AbrB family looped-hinge helix DNA binding protein
LLGLPTGGPDALHAGGRLTQPRGILATMKATIDKAGRLVIPRPLRERIGLAAGGTVEIELEGAGLRIRPVSGSQFREQEDLLVMPRTGTSIEDAFVRELIDADRH